MNAVDEINLLGPYLSPADEAPCIMSSFPGAISAWLQPNRAISCGQQGCMVKMLSWFSHTTPGLQHGLLSALGDMWSAPPVGSLRSLFLLEIPATGFCLGSYGGCSIPGDTQGWAGWGSEHLIRMSLFCVVLYGVRSWTP